jgi:hypothetical protein
MPCKDGKLAGFCVCQNLKGEKWMVLRVMLFVWPCVLDLVAVMRMTDDEKDLEIMLLR